MFAKCHDATCTCINIHASACINIHEGTKKRDLCIQKDTLPLFNSSCKRVRVMMTPLPFKALLKRKTGVYRGTIMFLIFALKHRL